MFPTGPGWRLNTGGQVLLFACRDWAGGGKNARPQTMLARLFETLPLLCPLCGGEVRLIAFITEAAPVERLGRCAILLRFKVQGGPSAARSHDATKVQWTVICLRRGLAHIREPPKPSPITPARGSPDWDNSLDAPRTGTPWRNLPRGTCSISASVGDGHPPRRRPRYPCTGV
jgi:hypothetical protein